MVELTDRTVQTTQTCKFMVAALRRLAAHGGAAREAVAQACGYSGLEGAALGEKIGALLAD